MLENSANILCVNFKSKRKGTPFQSKTYLMMRFFCILNADFFFSRLSEDNYWLFLEKFESSLKMNYGFQTSEGLFSISRDNQKTWFRNWWCVLLFFKRVGKHTI